VASLTWNSRLDPTVDLINIHFNKIDECIKYINDDIEDKEGNCERTIELINQLEQLCQLQFMYEEQLLEGLKYPLVNDQRKTHKLLLETFEPLKLESNQCHSPSFVRAFFKIRLDLVSNMNYETMKLCDFIIDSYS
jgi:hemerythrin